MWIMRTPLLKGLVVLAAAALVGCQYDEGSTGTYKLGRLEATFEATPQHVADASKAAVDQLHFNDVTTRMDGMDGSVTAKTSDGKKVSVSIDGKSDNLTQVTVSIGMLGDESMSRQVLDKIRSNLPLADKARNTY